VSARHVRHAIRAKAFVLMLAIASCAPPRTAEATLHTENAQDQAHLREACNVTAHVCTRCHDFARVTLVKFDRPERWRLLVSRMRYMQSSGITEEEAHQATECLVFRSFGQAGLDELAHLAPANANGGANAPSAPAPTHAPAPASSEPGPAPAAPITPSVPAPKEIP
jgi:hypothetical protein